MRVEAKGKNDYTTIHHVPSQGAGASTNVVLSAFRVALDTVLAQVTSQNGTATNTEAQMTNYVALRNLADELRDDLEHAEVVLQVIEAKLTTVD